MATYYHGSPNPDLTSLRSGSYITPDPELAKIFGRHNPETGKTWSDDDFLNSPHEHTIKRELPVRRFHRQMNHFANFFSAQAEGNKS